MAILTPEAIGVAHALDMWGSRGRSVILRPRVYHDVIAILAERLDGDDLAAATAAFDKRFSELAGSSSVIITPKLPQKWRRR